MAYHSFTIELLPFDLECEVDYNVYPGEPMVRYDSNGTGYPGSPPEVEILDLRVVEVLGNDYSRLPGDWEPVLRKMVEDVLDYDWLASEIFDLTRD